MASILFVFLRAKRSHIRLRLIFVLANATFAFSKSEITQVAADLFSF